jgi:hypothetical protein
MPKPTVESVRRAMAEFRKDRHKFIQRYASGRDAWYVLKKGRHEYPAKALWAAAHRPPKHTRNFHTDSARSGFHNLGFGQVSLSGAPARKGGPFKPDAKITVLAAPNPKRPGSAARQRFAAYRTGMSVAQALRAGVWYGDMRYDTKHRYIRIK